MHTTFLSLMPTKVFFAIFHWSRKNNTSLTLRFFPPTYCYFYISFRQLHATASNETQYILYPAQETLDPLLMSVAMPVQ